MNNIKSTLACLAITAIFAACGGAKQDPTPTIPTTTTVSTTIEDKGWAFETTPFYADEFDYTGKPNTDKWGYDTGGGGWGNSELEYYTNGANADVANGILTITAKKESMGGMNYSSARMVSKNLGSTKYGRIEIKAKLPAGVGTWPAIWMLPDDYVYGAWPKSGEIDIMEMVGWDPNNVHFTVHNFLYNGANGKGAGLVIPSSSTDYHTYRVDWTPYAVRGFYDDVPVFTYVNNAGSANAYPYDQKFHLLMNIAVGGSWGGQKGVDDTIFPVTMNVDYVRFYKMIDK